MTNNQNEDHPQTLILCELHSLNFSPLDEHRKDVLECLSLLRDDYELLLIHGNNFSAYYRWNDFGIYDAMEFTFIKKSITQIIVQAHTYKDDAQNDENTVDPSDEFDDDE